MSCNCKGEEEGRKGKEPRTDPGKNLTRHDAQLRGNVP